MNLVALFCHVDDFCHAFEAEWRGRTLTTIKTLNVSWPVSFRIADQKEF